MEPGHEVEAPATDDPTPLPLRVDAIGDAVASSSTPQPAAPGSAAPPSAPSAETLLRAIATTEGSWFPSRYAADTGLPRDSLDEPLTELRLTELVRVAEWVKGLGQGYVLTPEGQAAAKNPAELERLRQARQAPPAPLPPTPGEQPDAPEAVKLTDESDSTDESRQDTELAIRPPMVVPILLMANALWFFVCAVNSIKWGLTPSRSLTEGHPEVLHRLGAVTGADLLNGEWWRLVTSCFVHIGVLHLVGNLFALAMMGPLAELLWGRSRLLLIYFISGLAGSALAMTLRPDALLAGASGAIWGIQMSLFAWLFAFRRHLPPDLASDWFRRLGVVFVLNAGVSFLPGVSWEGHLGGGIAGFLAAGLLNAARFGDQRRRISAWLMLALLPVLFVGVLVTAMDAKGMPGWQHLRQKLADAKDLREQAERGERVSKAQTEYVAQIEPRLRAVAPYTSITLRQPRAGAPEAILFLSPEADALYALAETKRSAERAAAAKAKVESLKADAEEVARLATREPVGAERFDQQRERAKAFAAARAKSFALLLEMLAWPEPPKKEAWEAWRASCRDADRLWAELMAR